MQIKNFMIDLMKPVLINIKFIKYLASVCEHSTSTIEPLKKLLSKSIN